MDNLLQFSEQKFQVQKENSRTRHATFYFSVQSKSLKIVKGGKTRVHTVKDIIGAEELTKRGCLRVTFESDPKPRIYVFANNGERERFLQTLNYIRGIDAPAKQMADNELSVFCGTWNQGNARPPQNLRPWLATGYDLYAIGVQESKYEPRSGFSSCDEDWTHALQNALGSHYSLVTHLAMWEIRLHIFVRTLYKPFISNVQTATEATGIAGVAGNKGAVAVSLRFQRTPMCFLNCHLAAHLEKVAERRQNVYDILKGISFGGELALLHTYVFWMGDLNYRINLPRDAVLELIAQQDWVRLQEKEQLKKDLREGQILHGFSEGDLRFPPTYKLETAAEGTALAQPVYTTKKLRVPSWCDRVLFHARAGSPLLQTNYKPVFDLTSSDHAPVMASFNLTILMCPRPSLFSLAFPHLACRAFLSLTIFWGGFPHIIPSTAKLGSVAATVSCPALFENSFNITLERKPLAPTTTSYLAPHVDASLVTAPLYSADPHYIAGEGVLVDVSYRHDGAAPAAIGSACISLVAATGPEPSAYESVVLSKGCRQGLLTGQVHVVFE